MCGLAPPDVLLSPYEIAPEYEVLLDKTELSLEILKMAQEAGAIDWSFNYPYAVGRFSFQTGQRSWKVDFEDPSEARRHFMEACDECEQLGLMEYAARLYRKARSVDPELPAREALEQVEFTDFSERLQRTLSTYMSS